MNDLHYNDCLDQSLYSPQDNSFLEVFHYKNSRGIETKEGVLNEGDIEALKEWLEARTPDPDELLGGYRILLSGSVGYTPGDSILMKIRWRREEFELIMREMCLPKEYAELFALGHSTFTYFGPFDLKSCCSYIFATSSEQLPCITAAAFYDPATKITSVFYQCQSENDGELEQAKSFLSSSSFVMDPLAPLVSIISSIIISTIRSSNEISSTLYGIEETTGHNALIGCDDSSAKDINLPDMDFMGLVKDLDSYSGSVEFLDLLSEEVIASLAQILHILDRRQESVAPLDLYMIGLQKLKNEAEYRITSLKNLLLHYRSHQKRCRTQLTVLYNFIAQRNNQLNFQIAQTTNALAKSGARDSATMKSIAIASKRDSSAMKTIAVLTMVFLPGTFIASFFSMPLFDWPASTSSHIATTSNFWIYWAVTLPLTLLVLVIWTVWIKIVVPRHDRQDEKILASWKRRVKMDEENMAGFEKEDFKKD